MNVKRKLAGALLLVLGSAGLLVACGPVTGETCTFDADCQEGEVCYLTVCAALCETDDDCEFEGDLCLNRENEESVGKVCQTPATSNNDNNPQGCTTNEQCQAALNDSDAFCSDGECIGGGDPPPTFYTIEIRDSSPVSRCADVSHGYKTPGAKVMYARLENGTSGAVLAYASAAGEAIKDDVEQFRDWSGVFDGSPPTLGADNCVVEAPFTRANGTSVNTGFRDDSAVVLGCGGSVFLTFKTGGTRIPLETSHAVKVGEYGKSCNAAYGDDFYDIYLCGALGEDVITNATCTHKLNTASLTGIGTVAVSLP
ncbi:MAG: hypothetical protein H0U74_01565 [Bradymonadaceae bacterium]|nr:hypothetical protein [Lujinxingiaceae bacterium]